MHVISVVLFNSQSNFMFKIWLFRCNVNETSITLIILIFPFIEKTFKNGKNTVEIYTDSPYLNLLPLYTPAGFRQCSHSPCLRTYVTDSPLQFMTMKVSCRHKTFNLLTIGCFCRSYIYTKYLTCCFDHFWPCLTTSTWKKGLNLLLLLVPYTRKKLTS